MQKTPPKPSTFHFHALRMISSVEHGGRKQQKGGTGSVNVVVAFLQIQKENWVHIMIYN